MTHPAPAAPLPRRFHLQRDRDGQMAVVAHGVIWPDGGVTVRFLGRRPATKTYATLADAEAIHCHAGATRVVWDDPNPTGGPDRRAAR